MPNEEVERGEKGGVVLDGGEAQEVDESGEKGDLENAIENTKDEETDESLNESGEKSDADGGTKDSEAGGDGAGEEDGVPGEGEKPGVQNDDRLKVVEETLKAVREKLEKPPEEAPKPMSDEEWAKVEQDWGIPRPAIERMTQQNVKVINTIKTYIDSKFAELHGASALDNLAKDPKFSDAKKYEKDVNEFLKDYAPEARSNPTVLQKAVFYARGVHASDNMKKVRDDKDRNVRIAGAARPSSPGGGTKRPAAPALTGAHREAARIMGDESEYQALRTRPSRVIEQ